MRVSAERERERLADRRIVDIAFMAGRRRRVEATLHAKMIGRTPSMMTSEQLRAFDVSEEPAALLPALRPHAVWTRLPGRAAT